MCDMANIINMLAAFRVAYPNFSPLDTKETSKLLYSFLSDIPSDGLQAAIITCINEPGRVFAPSVGEIRGAYLSLKAKTSGIPDANTAYREVSTMPASMYKSASGREWKYGTQEEYYLTDWSHPFVGEIATLMGWPGQFPTDNPSADRAQFVKFYSQRLSEKLSDEHMPAALSAYMRKFAQDKRPELPSPKIIAPAIYEYPEMKFVPNPNSNNPLKVKNENSQ